MNPIDQIAQEAALWRRHLHSQPEILFDLPQTAAFVAEKLRAFGCDHVHTGIATSGIVAEIAGGRGPGRTIALRADMDALPMEEETNLPYRSQIAGRMHACGHDGHTATLLGAACHLARHRDFAGKVVLIFQPAEEGGAGGRVMVEEGVLDRFGVQEVYAMHNRPGLPVGQIASRTGPILAGGDRFVITLTGQGGHAATPHLATDQILAQAHLVTALQAIVARRTDPMDNAVLSITYISGGSPDALNVMPAAVRIGGTLRSMTAAARASNSDAIRAIVAATASMFGITAEVDWRPGYPVTVNDPACTKAALDVAAELFEAQNVGTDCPAEMGSEDFSYMLQERPGAFLWLGNGDSAALHNPAYDFNDAAIPHGIRLWDALVRARTPDL